jgi:hypothetical protein
MIWEQEKLKAQCATDKHDMPPPHHTHAQKEKRRERERETYIGGQM